MNITSITAIRGSGGGGQTAYAAAKAGLMGLMIDVADAFGKQGIRINCIAPGIIDTPMRDASDAPSGRRPQGDRPLLQDLTRHRRNAWDIARAVLFLAGPDGRYVTGVLIPVDGGVTARSH